MRSKLLPRKFYQRPPDVVAEELLGKVLVKGGDTPMAGRIVEVEAYFDQGDPAAHSFAGKTARNAVLFGPPGHAYVYFIYGMHYCLNVSCEPEGRGGGVLFRALEPVGEWKASVSLRGPGRLCRAFGITRERNNGADFTSPTSELQIRDDGFLAGEVLVTPRIGITRDADRLARFLLAGNPFVSGGTGPAKKVRRTG